MNNWFEVKVVYPGIDQTTGNEKKIKESYLANAVNFSDAETMVSKELEQIAKQGFKVDAIKRSNITEVLANNNESGYWFRVKIKHMTIDEISAREKMTNTYMLVESDSAKNVSKCVDNETKDWIVDPEIVSITETAFVAILIPESFKTETYDQKDK